MAFRGRGRGRGRGGFGGWGRDRIGKKTEYVLFPDIKIIDCLDHSQTCDELMEFVNDLRVQQLLHQAGFWAFLQLRYIRFDRPLLTALCDRWRPETCTFHFSVGEMTITLQDVAILLGLPIDGAPVNYFDDVNVDEICFQLLGEVPPPNAVVYGRDLKVTYIVQLIRGHEITEDSSVEQIEQFTRAMILYVISSRLFPNHSKGRVSIRWLYLLQDFATIGDYSWGSAVLCTLFEEMSIVALGKSNSLGGCLTLLQVWSWTRISIGRPNVGISYTDGLPYGARWTGARRWKDNPARHTTLYRNELDVLDQSQVLWTPYTDDVLQELPQVCLDGQHSWYTRTPIICMQYVCMHYPDRVFRQFGLNQHIPEEAEKVFPDGWSRNVYDAYVYRWNHRLDYIQVQRYPPISLEEYYSWYWHITRRFILKESSSRLPRYAPRGPVERDLEDVSLPSTPVLSTLTAEEKRIVQMKSKLERFWSNSCYHLQEDSFPKSETMKDGKRKKPKVQGLEEDDDDEIERYSDRFKPKKSAEREALNSYLVQIPSNFPAELIQGAKSSKRATKKLRWDSGGKLADIFAKFEERYKDNEDDDDDDGEKKKKKDGDEDEDDEQEEEKEEVQEESDGDYNENEYFDDDEDDFNMEEEPDEQYYND